MSLNHGINTYKSDTDFAAVKTAGVGIPLFIGAWPCHTAGGFTGKPQLVTSFGEAKELGERVERCKQGSQVESLPGNVLSFQALRFEPCRVLQRIRPLQA